jgi:hypothetical protein
MSGPGAVDKPILFVSHATTDEPIARVVRDEVKRIFANGVTVFASSVPGTIPAGSDWLESIRSNLEAATAVAVLITPVSINRPWIWFEVGASWAKMRAEEGRIYPLCVPEVEKSELPEPLNRLQALSLGKASETREFFQALCDQFGFGNLKGFRHASIKTKLPKYEELTVAAADIGSGALYTGPYIGYSRSELREVISEYYLRPEYDALSHRSRPRKNIFTEQLIHFARVDDRLDLPPGTAKAELAALAAKMGAEVRQHTENTLRLFMPREMRPGSSAGVFPYSFE